MKKLTNSQISSISNELLNVLPVLFNYFEIDAVEYPNRYSFPCPVHGGDSPEGCSIFTDGLTRKGNWQCWTAHCEEEYTNNLFGFVRGCLCAKRNKKVSMNQAADFCLNIINKKIDDLEDGGFEKTKSANVIEYFNRKIERAPTDLTRDQIRSKIDIPSKYFLGRGFSENVLNTFDVGDCVSENLPMRKRAVVPIYDEDGKYLGCVGRSKDNETKPKWLHSKGFKKNVLYGLNIAHKYIKESSSVILVEGQGDVWRMHEAGFKNCVGIFGSSLNEDQLLLLEQSGALDVVVLTDSDDAGNKAYEQILKKCGRRFNYYRPKISSKDVGDMSIDKIKEELCPQIEGSLINED